MTPNVPDYPARVKMIGSTGMTNDINADHAQIVLLSDFVNALPPGGGPANTDGLPEGVTNQYYTAVRVANKADLLNGIVPLTQLPSGAVMVKHETGKHSYFSGFLAYFTGSTPLDGDTVYFGPGTFDDSGYRRIIITRAITIVLGPQTVWKINELLPYAGYANASRNLFGIDGSGTGKLIGHIMWYSDSGNATETRVVDLRNLVHEGTIQHDWAGGPRLSLSAIQLRLTNVVSSTIGVKQYANTGPSGAYILSVPQYGALYRPLDIEIRNCRHTVEQGAVVQHLVNLNGQAAGPAPLTMVRMYNCVAYLSDVYQGRLVVSGAADSLSVDYQNVRVKTLTADALLSTPSIEASGTGGSSDGAFPTKLQIRSTSTNRVLTLRINEAVMLTALTAIAANNSSGASFQVNKYQSSDWVAGTERTTLATAQADIAALTTADFASGAELLIKTIPVSASAEAYILVEFTYGT